jgi:hypothetical protein
MPVGFYQGLLRKNSPGITGYRLKANGSGTFDGVAFQNESIYRTGGGIIASSESTASYNDTNTPSFYQTGISTDATGFVEYTLPLDAGSRDLILHFRESIANWNPATSGQRITVTVNGVAIVTNQTVFQFALEASVTRYRIPFTITQHSLTLRITSTGPTRMLLTGIEIVSSGGASAISATNVTPFAGIAYDNSSLKSAAFDNNRNSQYVSLHASHAVIGYDRGAAAGVINQVALYTRSITPSRMAGAKLYGSNSKYSGYVELATLANTTAEQFFGAGQNWNYRYLLVYNAGNYCELAELKTT